MRELKGVNVVLSLKVGRPSNYISEYPSDLSFDPKRHLVQETRCAVMSSGTLVFESRAKAVASLGPRRSRELEGRELPSSRESL